MVTLPYLTLEIAEPRERGVEAQPLPVAAVDSRHERLDDALVHFATEASRYEPGDRLFARVACRGHRALVRERCAPSRRQQRASGQRVDARRDHAREPLGQRVERTAMPNERSRVVHLPRDETTGKPQLLAETHAAGLPGEE